jgi:site-specific DNA-methyltransferase (adenine-specific)
VESHAAVSFAATETGVARLALGDCLELLRREPTASVDLVYMDPPFNTGRVHSAAAGRFDDRFDSLAAYLEFLEPRLRECHRVLRATGSILVHCDWRTSHRVRCLLDDIFGADRFVNHLVWSYGLGGSGPRSFARKHDDILFYGRSREYWFEAPRVAATSRRLAGMTKKATDVLDIPAINNLARERTGYPTQKPIALLAMLVDACCAPGGVVLDPCCGSGTSLVAALASGRRGIGFDLNPQAIAIAKDRLAGGEWTADPPSVAPRRAG